MQVLWHMLGGEIDSKNCKVDFYIFNCF